MKKKLLDTLVNLIDKYEEQILYVVFGLLTTLINIVTYISLTKILLISSFVSNIIAWFLSVLFAYITNKIWVFKNNDYKISSLKREIISFVSARGVSGLLDISIMFIFVEKLLMNDIIVKVVSNILVIILNYIFSKLYVFKRRESKNE